MAPVLADEELLELIREVPEASWCRIVEALEYAGCSEPVVTGDWLRILMHACANSNNVEMEGKLQGVRVLDDSLLSKRMKGTNMRRFHAYIRQAFQADIRSAMKVAPPSTRPVACVDGHIKETTGRPPKHGERTSPHARRSHLVRCTSDNKRYAYGTSYLVGVLAWYSNGKLVVCPFMFHLCLRGEGQTPLAQAKITHACLKPYKKQVRAILLDRFYDDHRLRNWLTALGWTVVTRMRFSMKQSRWLIDPETGKKVDLRSLAQELVDHGDLKLAYGKRFDGSNETYYTASRVGYYQIQDDQGLHPVSAIRLSIAVKVGPDGAEIDAARSLIVVARGAGDIAKVVHAYRLRWRVETILEQLGDGKPKPRPKTIQAEYVQYLTLCYCLMVGLMVRLLILVNSPDGRFLGERLERYSIPTLWRFALGLRRVAVG